MERLTRNKKGYILISAVLFLGMAVLALSLYLAWLAGFMFRGGADLDASKQAEHLADACAETALQKIWDNGAYVGSGSLTGCTYQVLDLGGENRQINATGTIKGNTKKTKLLIDTVNTKVNVSSWRAVGDF